MSVEAPAPVQPVQAPSGGGGVEGGQYIGVQSPSAQPGAESFIGQAVVAASPQMEQYIGRVNGYAEYGHTIGVSWSAVIRDHTGKVYATEGADMTGVWVPGVSVEDGAGHDHAGTVYMGRIGESFEERYGNEQEVLAQYGYGDQGAELGPGGIPAEYYIIPGSMYEDGTQIPYDATQVINTPYGPRYLRTDMVYAPPEENVAEQPASQQAEASAEQQPEAAAQGSHRAEKVPDPEPEAEAGAERAQAGSEASAEAGSEKRDPFEDIDDDIGVAARASAGEFADPVGSVESPAPHVEYVTVIHHEAVPPQQRAEETGAQGASERTEEAVRPTRLTPEDVKAFQKKGTVLEEPSADATEKPAEATGKTTEPPTDAPTAEAPAEPAQPAAEAAAGAQPVEDGGEGTTEKPEEPAAPVEPVTTPVDTPVFTPTQQAEGSVATPPVEEPEPEVATTERAAAPAAPAVVPVIPAAAADTEAAATSVDSPVAAEEPVTATTVTPVAEQAADTSRQRVDSPSVESAVLTPSQGVEPAVSSVEPTTADVTSAPEPRVTTTAAGEPVPAPADTAPSTPTPSSSGGEVPAGSDQAAGAGEPGGGDVFVAPEPGTTNEPAPTTAAPTGGEPTGGEADARPAASGEPAPTTGDTAGSDPRGGDAATGEPKPDAVPSTSTAAPSSPAAGERAAGADTRNADTNGNDSGTATAGEPNGSEPQSDGTTTIADAAPAASAGASVPDTSEQTGQDAKGGDGGDDTATAAAATATRTRRP